MRVLVTGATGQLGPYVIDALACAGWNVVAWSGHRRVRLQPGIDSIPVPLEDAQAVSRAWQEAEPEAVVHAAAVARIDACYADPRHAHQVNVTGTETLCDLADRSNVPVVYISTDLVFDGSRGRYTEQDEPRPVSVYGQTKLRAEQIVLRSPRNVVLRMSLLFGPGRCGVASFLDRVLRRWRQGEPMRFFEDEWRSPLALSDAAEAIRLTLSGDLRGLYHVGGPERLSRWEMGVRFAQHMGYPEQLLQRARRAEFSAAEPRPADVSLCSDRFREAVADWQPHRFPGPWLTEEGWRRGSTA